MLKCCCCVTPLGAMKLRDCRSRRGGPRAELRPGFHQLAPVLQTGGAPICSFNGATDLVRQSCLDGFTIKVRVLASPVTEARAEAVRGDIVMTQRLQQSLKGGRSELTVAPREDQIAGGFGAHFCQDLHAARGQRNVVRLAVLHARAWNRPYLGLRTDLAPLGTENFAAAGGREDREFQSQCPGSGYCA